MSDFDKMLIPLYEAVKREKIRCICILACVVLVLASALGVMFYLVPLPTTSVTSEPVTYSHTDTNGTTTTVTTNGNQTITTVTNADGKILSTSIVSSRRRK